MVVREQTTHWWTILLRASPFSRRCYALCFDFAKALKPWTDRLYSLLARHLRRQFYTKSKIEIYEKCLVEHTPASYKATGFGALRYANLRFALEEQSATSSLTSELVDEDVLDYHGLRPCGLTTKREITARAIFKDFDASVNIPHLDAYEQARRALRWECEPCYSITA